MKKVPKRRFKGFLNAGDWEQRKLGDVVKRESVTQVSSTEYPAIEYEDVIPETGQLNKDIYKKGVQKAGILFDANKVLYGKLRPYLHNWVAPMYKGVAVGDWWVLNPCGLDRGFLYTLIQTVKFDTIANQSTGSKMPRADWKLLSTTEFSIPSLDEQIKIGKLVEGLNDYITLHQRKLENLKLKKKALLQKLFPKNGEQFPELRFPGFTDAWEQRKFTYLLDKKDGIRRGPFGSALKKNSFVKESQYTVYEQQNAIYDKFDTRYNITKEKFDELHKFQLVPGDFIMSGAGTIGRISRVPNGIKAGVFNQALIRFKIDETLVDSEYFLEWMRSEGMQKKFTKANPGSAMVNLVPMSEVKEWEVLLPTKDEQYKIGRLLSKISNLITLHQRKLEHLQLQKKALLQQMFV